MIARSLARYWLMVINPCSRALCIIGILHEGFRASSLSGGYFVKRCGLIFSATTDIMCGHDLSGRGMGFFGKCATYQTGV